MTPIVQQILVYALLPALGLSLGGLIAVYFRLSIKLQSAVLHFAAGVIFSVVAVEILPEVVHLHHPVLTALGFGAGILLMLLIRQWTEAKENQSKKKDTGGKWPITFLIVIGIDVFVDGLLLGVGFAAGAKQGKLLAFALGIESLSLGLATATSLVKNKLTRGRISSLIVGFAALFLLSTGLGANLLQNVSEQVLDMVLSVGLAALLFLVTDELLTEAHIAEEPAWLTATFYAGFLFFLLLGMVM
ncbi:membrane protein [Spirosoma migulaei]